MPTTRKDIIRAEKYQASLYSYGPFAYLHGQSNTNQEENNS